MATSFPSSLDSFTNPLSSDTLSSPSHAGQHTDLNDAVAALQSKVGADSSAVTSSHDYKIADHASRITTLEAASTGKILQVVYAYDATLRSTTSWSLVDANISVTITPTSSTNNIILYWSADWYTAYFGSAVITDSSNVDIGDTFRSFGKDSGTAYAHYGSITCIGVVSAGNTSSRTYKGRFKSIPSATTSLNANSRGYMFALEVAT